ncbi:MAG: ribosomal RNA small subunit methyltransferase A [Phycisphaera sp.]|nr:MAG: ribosomal RNA small subunit methyltransferase A [Phycisphaera sp.]
MQTLAQIRQILDERCMSPRHRLGQNFLIDHNLIRKLIDASGVCAGDLVLEIGPGTGTMTEELLDRGCKVVACELDVEMADLLRDRLGARDGFVLIEGDCLESKHELSRAVAGAVGDEGFTLVANLPYGAATPVMLALLLDWPACKGQYVTIQREVADRLMAKPGSKAYGVISVIAQLFADVEMVAKLPRECFWPQPDVASAMVSIAPTAGHKDFDRRMFATFCQKLLGQRRKQLGGMLGKDGVLPEGFDPKSRAESLSPSRFLDLYLAQPAR